MIRIRKKTLQRVVIPLIIALVVLGIGGAIAANYIIKNREQPPEYGFDKSIFGDLKLSDVRSLYDQYDQTEVINVYLTAYSGVDETTGKLFDFASMTATMSREEGDPMLAGEVRIESGKTSEVFVDGGGSVNCEISLRGESARRSRLKSYKIKIYDNMGSFRGQSVLNLNKHYGDPTKFRNKFCFDAMSYLTDMVSLRTTFVRLYIKDAVNGGEEYVDYGLYTHVEQPNKSFLSAHGLDPNGTLYKPSDFEFYMDEGLLPEDDPDYDYGVFSQYLRVRENSDNKKLLKVIEAINDYDQNFDVVFSQYFDVDNYLTWVAMNLILDNYDTVSRNFLLYSPSYSEKWYFLPWDYDGTLLPASEQENSGIYHFFGLERYWGAIIHNRFFRNPDNVALLDEKIEEVYEIFTSQEVLGMVDGYRPVVLEFLNRAPDSDIYSSLTRTYECIDAIEEVVRENRTRYYESKERPMPYYMGRPRLTEEGFYFNWNASYDFQGDSIYYDLTIGKDPGFNEVIHSATSLYATEYIVDIDLDPGIYYWRVTAQDSKGNRQNALEYYRSPDREYYYGVKQFTVD